MTFYGCSSLNVLLFIRQVLYIYCILEWKLGCLCQRMGCTSDTSMGIASINILRHRYKTGFAVEFRWMIFNKVLQPRERLSVSSYAIVPSGPSYTGLMLVRFGCNYCSLGTTSGISPWITPTPGTLQFRDEMLI